MPLHPRAFAIVAREGRTGSLSNAFAELLIKAGLREPMSKAATGRGRSTKRKGSDLSFHSLRYTSINLLHEAGVPAAVAMRVAGHDDEAVHRHYIDIGRSALEEAVAIMPEL